MSINLLGLISDLPDGDWDSTDGYDGTRTSIWNSVDGMNAQSDKSSILLFTKTGEYLPPEYQRSSMEAIPSGEPWDSSFERQFISRPKHSVPPTRKVQPPDISAGLGNRPATKDIVALEEHIVARLDLIKYKDALCLYEGPCWKAVNEENMVLSMRKLFRDDGELFGSLARSDYHQIYQGLRTHPDVESLDSLPSSDTLINCRDGVLNLETLRIRPACPEDYFFSFVDISAHDILHPPMTGHAFEAFAAQVGNGDDNVRTQLLELLILALTGMELKYFYVLLGPSHTGKTQYGRFLEELLGRENVESVRGVGDFGDRWTVGSLCNKKLATCLDLPDAVLPPAAVGTIKQFVGDDPVKGECKYQNSFTYYKKPLLLLAGNHPIRIANMEKEQAFLNRMVVIPFANPVAEDNMVRQLYKSFLEEAPYIINCAIDVFHDLQVHNYSVTHSAVPSEYSVQEGNQARLDVGRFIDDCIVADAKGTASSDELYQCFLEYADDCCLTGISSTCFSRLFSRLVSVKVPDAKPEKRVSPDQRRGYSGISIL